MADLGVQILPVTNEVTGAVTAHHLIAFLFQYGDHSLGGSTLASTLLRRNPLEGRRHAIKL